MDLRNIVLYPSDTEPAVINNRQTGRRMRPSKKIGAPPRREPRPGERIQLGVRVTPEAKRRLEKAAAEFGRSISQEAELRLERSFDRDDLLNEVLSLAYGRQVAGILMLLGSVLPRAG